MALAADDDAIMLMVLFWRACDSTAGLCRLLFFLLVGRQLSAN
jgi:hypothetical protein